MFENISPQRREVIVSRDGNHCFYRAVASVFMLCQPAAWFRKPPWLFWAASTLIFTFNILIVVIYF